MNTTTRKVLVSIVSAVAVLSSVGLLVYNGVKGGKKVDEPKVEEKKTIPPLEFTQPTVPDESGTPEADGEQQPSAGEEVLQPPADNPPEPQEQPPKLEELAEGDLWQKLCSRDVAAAFVTFLDEISMGAMPVKSLGEFKSTVKFTATEKDGEWFISEESEKRYEPFVDLFCAIDAKRAAKVFNAMKPALQKAFNLLGYKDRDIDDLLYSVLETAREIPLYESNPPMVRLNDNMFTWQYAELEKLSPAQKCVMRMGQGNVKRIREQVERLAAESGLENLQDELQ